MFRYVSNSPEKIFGIGLSRTGTTSLNAALNILSYRTFHWRFDPGGRILSPEDAYYCDGITDINASFAFETLFRIFPKAKFIYTTRPSDSWVPSITHHYDAATPKVLERRLRQVPVTNGATGIAFEQNDPLFHAIHHSLYTSHGTWADAYAAHDRRVRDFFAKYPGKFLELDLFVRKDAWKPLCRFLGKNAPKAKFPAIRWRRGE